MGQIFGASRVSDELVFGEANIGGRASGVQRPRDRQTTVADVRRGRQVDRARVQEFVGNVARTVANRTSRKHRKLAGKDERSGTRQSGNGLSAERKGKLTFH